jgi:GrpB-like predicted nucleotidyltransferase (UPF0157 family)
MSRSAPIHIQEYTADWQQTFTALRAVYAAHLAGLVVAIEHVGSTSVPGLAAKPVIDIDLVIESRTQLPAVLEALAKLGYSHAGDQGITDREAFKRSSDLAPIDGGGIHWQRHNLYVCVEGSIALKNHLTLRDHLRTHPADVQAYSDLKRKILEEDPYDIDRYIRLKTPFIIDILRRYGFDASALSDISRANGLV